MAAPIASSAFSKLRERYKVWTGNSMEDKLFDLNILASRSCHSGILETSVPDTETAIDWLDYPSSEMEFLSSPKPLCGA